jgi:hypothetical protein
MHIALALMPMLVHCAVKSGGMESLFPAAPERVHHIRPFPFLAAIPLMRLRGAIQEPTAYSFPFVFMAAVRCLPRVAVHEAHKMFMVRNRESRYGDAEDEEVPGS